MCISIQAVRLCPEAAAQFVCAQQTNYNHPYCYHQDILFFFYHQPMEFLRVFLSFFISLCLPPPLPSLPPSLFHPSLPCLVVSTWWIASKWRMLWVPYFERFYLERGANWRCFSLRCICSSLPFLHPSFSPSPTICVTVLTLFSLFPLSQPAARQCRRRMLRCWKEARPRSSAACTTTTDQSWSSKTLAGRLSSSTAQEVRRNACNLSPFWRVSSLLTFADLSFVFVFFRHISEKLACTCASCFFSLYLFCICP